MSLDVLPNCIPRTIKDRVFRAGVPWVPIFCANCGCPGGHVPEPTTDPSTGFAFYLCDPCAAKWAPLAGTMLIPDEVFWAKVKEAQLEEFGRELESHEVIAALADENHILSKLVRERTSYRKE